MLYITTFSKNKLFYLTMQGFINRTNKLTFRNVMKFQVLIVIEIYQRMVKCSFPSSDHVMELSAMLSLPHKQNARLLQERPFLYYIRTCTNICSRKHSVIDFLRVRCF